MEPNSIRRHPGNSIDHGFYRRGAAKLRAEAMREFARPLRIGLLALGTVAAVVIAAAAPAHRADCPYCSDSRDVAASAATTTGMLAAPARVE